MGRVFRGLLAFALLAAAMHTCDADGNVTAERPSGGMSEPKAVRLEARARFMGSDLC